MPQIPMFDAPPMPNPAPLPSYDVEAGGRAAEALARGAAQVGGAAQDFAEQYTQNKRVLAASDIMVGAHNELGTSAAKWQRLPDMAQAQQGFADDAQQIRTKLLAGVQDPHLAAIVAERFDNAQVTQAQEVRASAFDLERSGRVGDLDLYVNDRAHDYAAALTDEGRQSVYKDVMSRIGAEQQAGIIGGAAAAEMTIRFRSRADYAQAYRDIDVNPAAALQKLNDPANYGNMDELTRGRLIARAESKSDTNDALARGQVDSAWRDNVAALQANGAPAVPLSEGQIRAAFPDRADEMIAQQNMAGQFYRAVKSTALTSPQQDAALVAKWQPQGAGFAVQEGAQDALRKALSDKYQKIGADAAGYVLGASPEIKTLFDQAQRDPKQLGPAIGALDAAYDKIGVPREARHVLSVPAAQQLVSQITSSPAQAPDTFKSLAAQYGIAWPRAWRDLTTLGGLPATWQAVPLMENERDGALMARWLAEAPKDKPAGDLIGTKAESVIKASVRSDPGVTALLTSLSHSGASAGQTDDLLHAIDALAFAKTYYDRDPRGAQNAIDAFTSQYEFMPNGGARVPKDQFDDVSTRAGQTLDALTLDKIAVPPTYGQPGRPKPQEFVDWIKAAPNWITAPSADALMLMDPAGRLVRGRDGKPLTVPFAALAGGAGVAPGAAAGSVGGL